MKPMAAAMEDHRSKIVWKPWKVVTKLTEDSTASTTLYKPLAASRRKSVKRSRSGIVGSTSEFYRNSGFHKLTRKI